MRISFKKIFDYYNSFLAFGIIGDITGLIETRKKKIISNNTFTKYSATGENINIKFLIATKSQGLLYYTNGEIIQLSEKKGFYGITKLNSTYYTFFQTGLHGTIISFEIKNSRMKNVEQRIYGLSRGVHQIDFIGTDLCITNTYENSLLIYKNIENKNNLHWKKHDHKFFPAGKLKKGRKSHNYAHFNSIYKYQNIIYLMAHNETKKTGRFSEIYHLNNDYQTVKKETTTGSNCHNIYYDQGNKIYCKSLEGIVNVNSDDKLKHMNVLTRGLSVAKDFIIIGGSDIQFDRNKRNNTDGHIYIYEHNYKLLINIEIYDTQVQEICRVDTPEKSLSNI